MKTKRELRECYYAPTKYHYGECTEECIALREELFNEGVS